MIILLLYKDEGHHILQRFYDCTLDIKRVTAPDTRYAHSFYHPLRGEFEKKKFQQQILGIYDPSYNLGLSRSYNKDPE